MPDLRATKPSRKRLLLLGVALGAALFVGSVVMLTISLTRTRTVTVDLRDLRLLRSVPWSRNMEALVILPNGRQFHTPCRHVVVDHSGPGHYFYIYGPMVTAAEAAKQLADINS